MPSNDLQKIAGEANSKYIYYLLAASAAAIGYALQKAENLQPTYSLTFFGLCIILWAMSFYFGCKSVEFDLSVNNALANGENFGNTIEQAQKVLGPEEFKKIAVAYQDTLISLNKLIESHTEKCAFYLKLQLNCLIFGSLFFVLWRMMEIFKIDLGSFIRPFAS